MRKEKILKIENFDFDEISAKKWLFWVTYNKVKVFFYTSFLANIYIIDVVLVSYSTPFLVILMLTSNK